MAATRVYILARELGVKSSAIVKKCQDEGLDVKNHMTAISAGLAATIREWFSEGENVTTVETAEKVDLSEVRVKRPQRTKVMQGSPSKEEPVDVESLEAAVAEAEPSDETQTPQEETEAPAEAEAVAAVMEVEQAEEEPVQAPVVAVETVEPEPPVVVEGPTRAPVVETKKVEIEVLPAGPMLGKPKPAVLSGPQVVRVEAPEPLDRPRLRPRPRPRRDAAITEPLMYRGKEKGADVVAPMEADRKRGKHHKERTHGRRKEGVEEEAGKKPKLRGK